MSAFLNEDPPRPSGVAKEEWKDLIRYARLHAWLGWVSQGLGSPEPIEAIRSEYAEISSRISWERMLLANRAMVAWDEARPARERIAAAQRMRLSRTDDRAWVRASDDEFAWHERCQFAVGQGGFHVGAVTIAPFRRPRPLGEADFVYVYDCGSEPRSQVFRAVERLVGSRSPRRLDMLFLSHFDCDHMCGIPRLLDEKRGLRVDTIVLPYLDDVERIVAFARTASAREGRRIERFIVEMTVDPVAALGRFNPRQIILVRADDDDPPPEDVDRIDPPSGRGENLHWLVEDLQHLGRHAGAVWHDANGGALVMDGGSFTVFGRPFHGVWRLTPYVRRSDPEKLDRFKFGAELLLGWERGSFASRVSIAATRRMLVTRQRTILARAYKHAFADKNLTSMCLYSGPASVEQAGAIQLRPPLAPADCARVGWMGTGDAYLREEKERAEFCRYFESELGYVSTFVLPHHGSIHNTDPQSLVSSADLWVACAAPIHKDWEHPSAEIVKAIGQSGKMFWLVNAQNATELHEQVAVFWRH